MLPQILILTSKNVFLRQSEQWDFAQNGGKLKKIRPLRGRNRHEARHGSVSFNFPCPYNCSIFNLLLSTVHFFNCSINCFQLFKISEMFQFMRVFEIVDVIDSQAVQNLDLFHTEAIKQLLLRLRSTFWSNHIIIWHPKCS